MASPTLFSYDLQGIAVPKHWTYPVLTRSVIAVLVACPWTQLRRLSYSGKWRLSSYIYYVFIQNADGQSAAYSIISDNPATSGNATSLIIDTDFTDDTV